MNGTDICLKKLRTVPTPRDNGGGWLARASRCSGDGVAAARRDSVPIWAKTAGCGFCRIAGYATVQD
jgi:hypothetical protein